VTLEALNFHSQDWKILRSWLKSRQESLMLQLCSPASTEAETALCRGRLLEIKELLNEEEAVLRDRSN